MQGGRRIALLAVALGLALAATLAAAPPAQASHLAPMLAVNVVQARDLGCSDDAGDTADLRVSVFLDDGLALRTVKAQGHGAPWFGNLVAVSDPGRPFQVTIRVEEAEPGGAFLLGTDWVTCDVSPGAPQEFVTTWSGGVQEYVARGDAPGAEATVVIGPAPAAVPTLQASASAHALDLSWAAVAGTPRIASAPFTAGTALAAGATSHRLDGLCDGDWHEVRLAVATAAAGWWQVAGPTQAFRTADVAPQAPRVLSAAAAEGGWRVDWESRTTHDIARYEVLVGPDAAAPPSAVRASLAPFSDWSRQSTTAASAAGDAYAWVRAVDRGGNAATSPAFALGSPALSATGQHPWTRLDPCAAGLAAAPTADWLAPDRAEDVFAHEAGHAASSPSPSPPASSSSSPFWTSTLAPTSPDTGGRAIVTAEDRPFGDPVDPPASSSSSRTETLGWTAVAVAGVAVFALALALVTRLARRR